jgi:hypothetical protein
LFIRRFPGLPNSFFFLFGVIVGLLPRYIFDLLLQRVAVLLELFVIGLRRPAFRLIRIHGSTLCPFAMVLGAFGIL